MTVAALIEEIEKLSREEQLKVWMFLRDCLAARNSKLLNDPVDEEFKRIADEVFTENEQLFGKLAE